jgi:hypothetical protein
VFVWPAVKQVTVYSNDYATTRYNNIQMCGKPLIFFGVFRPSSGTYSRKKNAVMSLKSSVPCICRSVFSIHCTDQMHNIKYIYIHTRILKTHLRHVSVPVYNFMLKPNRNYFKYEGGTLVTKNVGSTFLILINFLYYASYNKSQRDALFLSFIW